MQIDIIKAKDNSQIEKIVTIAEEIWQECFVDIISENQINYMVDKFQSLDAIKNQIANENYIYYAVYCDDKLCGYIAIKEEEEKLFLSKLYLHKDYRGKGIASIMFEKIFDEGRKKSKKSVYLTVNKHNKIAIDVYKAKGLKITDSVVTDIGEGYVMDDYIFEYQL